MPETRRLHAHHRVYEYVNIRKEYNYLLSNEASYGYKLTQDVKDMMSISESTLYPVLKRLQTAVFLETYEMPIDGRNRK